MEPFPLIKLEVEGMKHSILRHFNLHQSNISDQVKKEIENVIDAFDFENAITKAASDILYDTIKQYFTFGEGSTIVRKAMQQALNNAFKDNAVEKEKL